MDRFLRIGAPALILALVFGCGSEEDATSPATNREAPGMPPPPPRHRPPPTPGGRPRGPGRRPDAVVPAPTEAAPAPADETKKEAEPTLEGPTAGEVKLSDEEIAAIKKLPADEQDAALKQAVCPVSDEHLGAMDMPLKVTAEGRTFYLCCEGCKKAVEEDPKAVIAKLDKK
ncbi:hypothetical protein [Planctomyces sp. SH-PL62]|uniref:hypothetical protein n=1 Tax=Planctomyces sp. SH-PL62 TaxID=1636152 RepID=UPI00078D9B9E|nr:hypothetical protein [Planctomyces sp. SH-PL62]AMV38692.1 hypothetical protein VT85_14735 [Planctomyces sp. SH-PL62]